MAEGGSPHMYPVEDTERGKPLDSHLLECPICLEQLRRPKSLPCLHTFCQECLGTYITKDLSGEMASATSFPCPICRTLTQPINPSEDQENWAQQFPTNCLIQEQVQGKTDVPSYCKLCKKNENIEMAAAVWCKTCKVPLCESCKASLHDMVLEGCETVEISSSFTLQLDSPAVQCRTHSETMEYYCDDHSVLGCVKCVISDHRRCEVVTTTREYCDALKGCSKWDEWTESLRKYAEAFELIINGFYEETKTRVKQQDVGFASITELRQRVDTRLNAMQKELTDELVSAIKEDKGNLEMTTQKCERLMSSIQNTLEYSVKAIKKNDYSGVIQSYQRGQAEIESCNDLMTEMRKSLMTVSIQHVVDSSLTALDKDAPLSLGKIVVQKQPRRLPDGTGYPTPLSERRLKEFMKFNIKSPSDTRNCYSKGVVYLPNNCIVLGDFENKKVKLFSAEGKFLDEIKLTWSPYELCLVDTTTVAVAVSSAVHMIQISSSKLSQSSIIETPDIQECHGITYTGRDFIVSTSNQNLCKVKRDGKVDRMYKCSANCYHLAYDQRQGYVYASQNVDKVGDVAVYRMSGQTTTGVMKVGFVKWAVGVDVDREGNVYICGFTSHNIVQMSGNGTNVRELLTSSDGVTYPRAISVWGDKVVVTSKSDKQGNEIRVFELY